MTLRRPGAVEGAIRKDGKRGEGSCARSSTGYVTRGRGECENNGETATALPEDGGEWGDGDDETEEPYEEDEGDAESGDAYMDEGAPWEPDPWRDKRVGS